MTLKEEYRKVLDKLAEEFERLTEKQGYWSADYTLWHTEYEAWLPDDMLFIVSEYDKLMMNCGDSKTSAERRKELFLAYIEKWIDYNVAVAEFGIQYINLKSWFMGVPRMSDNEINKLRALKKDLYDEIEEQKKAYGEQRNSSQPQHLADIYKPY